MHTFLTNLKSKETKIFFYLIIVLNIFALIPLLASGYYQDDFIWSYMRGVAGINGWNVLGYLYWFLKVGLSQGKLLPGSVVLGMFYWFFSYPVVLLKLVYLIGTIVSATLFFYFIKKISGSPWFSLLGMMLLSIFIQFRSYHDPILSYALLMQFILIFLIISLLCFYQFIQTGYKRKYLMVISVISFLCLLLTYEITFTFLLFLLVFAFNYHNLKTTIKLASPYFVCVLIITCVTVILRIKFSANIPHNYQPTFAEIPIIKTWGIQILSTLPFSFAFLFEKKSIGAILSRITLMDIVFFFSYFFVLVGFVNYLKPIRNKKLILMFSILLIILPGFMISLSPKYQVELKPGRGYLPVFHQIFGGILIVSMLFLEIRQRLLVKSWGKYLITAIMLCLAFLFTFNIKLNTLSVSEQNLRWFNPRSALERALRMGLFDNIPEGSLILAKKTGTTYWFQDGFYFAFTNKKYQIQDLDEYISKYIQQNKLSTDQLVSIDTTGEIYLLDFDAINNKQGYAILGKSEMITSLNGKNEVKVSNAELFLGNESSSYLNWQNLILGNNMASNNYIADVSFGNEDTRPNCHSRNSGLQDPVNIKGKIIITSPRKGSYEIYNCDSQGNMPFIINNLQLSEK